LAAIGNPFHKSYRTDDWNIFTHTGEIDVLDPGASERIKTGANDNDTDAVILILFEDPDGKRHYAVTRFTSDSDTEDWWKLRASRNFSNRFALSGYLRVLLGARRAKDLARLAVK